jgi:sulfonate transport system substrate-binding protein
MTTRRSFVKLASLAAGIAVALPLAFAGSPARAENPDRITVDYAYYNPVALLLKEKGWFEDEFAKDDIDVRWVLSLGSNKALEFLNGGSADFASTAGAASVIGRANGIPIKAVYVYSKPEWTALVTNKDSDITRVEDLKGKRVAVTRGTDPHIFLLRALHQVGLSEKDIKPVLLQHPDGYRALASGQVDAWAGLDPHMAKAELEDDAQLFYRNAAFNTYGILNVREAFAKEHPDLVERVIGVYERGRKYALQHPDELQAVLVDAAKVDSAVAARQIEQRTDLSRPFLDEEHRAAFVAAGTILRDIGIIKEGIDIEQVVDELIDPRFGKQVATQ